MEVSSRKTIRVPSLKRGKPNERISDRIKLERVLGVTVSNNAALDSYQQTVAYPAGCTIVLFDTATGAQNCIISTCRKTISALAFSTCGRYLVTGECGHQPSVRIWDLQNDQQQPNHPGLTVQHQQVAEFADHLNGINCVAFSPNSKLVVSIGSQHDMIVNVWDWRTGTKVASNKVSTKVKAVAFAENGRYFVTVGNRHVKFWFLEWGKSKYYEAIPLTGRSGILGDQRNNYFCDVACGRGSCADRTFVITRSGLLCDFDNRRLMDRWVDLKTTSGNCVAVSEEFVFVGCAEGIVRCFKPDTLTYVTTLPLTHYLGVDVSAGLNIQHMLQPPPNAKYPDTIAITYDKHTNKLTCIYNDHSVYVWDVHNIKRVGKSHSFLYHSACIWGVEMAPPDCPLPNGSFITCSSDDTMRVWNLDKCEKNDPNQSDMYKRNVYSDELLKIVYKDEKSTTHLKDSQNATSPNDADEALNESRHGVRCIRISADGRNLGAGDRSGNIRIYETARMRELLKIEAHDAEVLCIEYTGTDTDKKFMASASRDRLIHVFDVTKDYNFIQTVGDHSSSITAVRFLNTPNGNLQMATCGADKTILFWPLAENPSGYLEFRRGPHAIGKATLYDMDVDVVQKHVLTACQDRMVRIYNAHNGKHTRSFKGSSSDDGSLIKAVLDRSGIYLATSCTDKSLSVFDYYTGDCMATMCGHSELATGLRFTNDCRRLISASGDGCIFVWKVPHDMVVTMHARLNQQALRRGKTLDNDLFPVRNTIVVDGYDDNTSAAGLEFRSNMGSLPQWAKRQLTDEEVPATTSKKSPIGPKGRWAQRADKNQLLKFIYGDQNDRTLGLSDSDSPSPPSRSLNAASSPLSSSTPYNKHLNNSVRENDVESSAHDGDIDSDQEYRHQSLYYPLQVDSASGSEYTVRNIDTDELRKSIRKSRKNGQSIVSSAVNTSPVQATTQQQATSASGSQDSDDDDDEASTPSGENTDRNMTSLQSVSSESLDKIVNRDIYLRSTFENMSGAETDTAAVNNTSSISSQYLMRANKTTTSTVRMSPRNLEIIQSAKQTQIGSQTSRKREELKKRIEETKKKLETVGYRSTLKSSLSTNDLSNTPSRDQTNNSYRRQVELDDENLDVSLRRACSLSDLALSMDNSNANNRQQSSQQAKSRKPQPPVLAQLSNRKINALSNIERSRSTGVLNQADFQNRLMQPTISSQNKMRNNLHKNVTLRKRHSHSAANLCVVGIEDSTSEEEIDALKKPAVPPRKHAMIAKSNGNGQIDSMARRMTVPLNERLDDAVEDLDETLTYLSTDFSTQNLTSDLCDKVTAELAQATTNVERLIDALMDDANVPLAQKAEMLTKVQRAIVDAMDTCRRCQAK